MSHDSPLRFPDHEEAVGALALEMGFTHVSLSSHVMPMVRVVPRGYTGQCRLKDIATCTVPVNKSTCDYTGSESMGANVQASEANHYDMPTEVRWLFIGRCL